MNWQVRRTSMVTGEKLQPKYRHFDLALLLEILVKRIGATLYAYVIYNLAIFLLIDKDLFCIHKTIRY